MENNQPPIPETNDLPPTVPGQEFQAPEVSVNVPPVENKPSVTPSTPKAKSKLMPILLIVLILVLLGVGGIYAYKNFFVKTPEPTPTPISTPEVTPDPTADWETYTNTKYKFSFKYPKEVKNSVAINGPFTTFKFTFTGPIQEASGRTQAELSDGYMITINVAPVTEAVTLQTLQLEAEKGRQGILNAGYGDNCEVSEINSGILDSAPTVEYTATDCMGNYRNILTFKGSIQYQITGLYTNTEYESIVNQILSTFKFTEIFTTPSSTDTAVKTYSGLGISFNYPSFLALAKPIDLTQKTSPGGSYQQSFNSTSGVTAIINIAPRKKNADETFMSLDEEFKSVSGTHFAVANQDALKVENSTDLPGAYNKYFVTLTKDLQSTITVNVFVQPADSASLSKGKALFDQIVTTFKFTQ